MSYRDRNRKTVTLPSGAVAVVTRLAPIHLLELGDIPLSDFGENPKKDQPKERTAKSLGPQLKFQNLILKNCVLAFEADGEKFKLVDKHPNDCEAGELSIHELEPADVEAIQKAVSSLDEGRLPARAKTFPEGQEPGSKVASNGQGIRHPTDEVAAPVVA